MCAVIATQGWGQQTSTPASPSKPAAPAAGTPASQPKPPESSLKALETKLKMGRMDIPGPQPGSNVSEWLADLKQYRELKLAELKYYRPELTWCQSSFVQPQMMVVDAAE